MTKWRGGGGAKLGQPLRERGLRQLADAGGDELALRIEEEGGRQRAVAERETGAVLRIDQHVAQSQVLAGHEGGDSLRVFALIDSRLPPQEMDLKFIHWLGTNEVPFALVFTKVDKQAAQHTRNTIDRFKAALAKSTAAQPPIFATSTTTKTGRSELLAFIEQSLVTPKQANPFAAPRMMSETSRASVVDPEDGDELE